MTTPVPADPNLDAPSLIGTGIQSLVNESRRLGLTWQLVLATVQNGETSQVICDGDTEAITAVSMMGPVYTGYRVYVLQVPPSGNYIVGVTSNSITWKGCSLVRAAVQSIPNASPTALVYDTEVEDTDNMWVSGSTVTIRTPGIWGITFGSGTTLAQPANSRNFVSIAINGMGDVGRNFFSEGENYSSCTIIIPLAAGRTIQGFLFQSGGGPRNATGSLWVYRLGDWFTT